MGRLTGVGLDYMKRDSVFIHGIDSNSANQALVRTLCAAGSAMGLSMIAEGVCNDAEWQTLRALGVDGVTGPGVTATLAQGKVLSINTPDGVARNNT